MWTARLQLLRRGQERHERDCRDRQEQSRTAEELSEPLTIGVEAYISEEYARAERDKLWRKVWQQAGRVEEIPEVGSYLTYDILDDSILIVRTASDKIRAYYNVCSHRGRRLVDTPAGTKRALWSEETVRVWLPCLDLQPRRSVHSRAR